MSFNFFYKNEVSFGCSLFNFYFIKAVPFGAAFFCLSQFIFIIIKFTCCNLYRCFFIYYNKKPQQKTLIFLIITYY